MTLRSAQLADAPAIAAIHIASWRATYAGLVAQDFLEGLDLSAFTASWQHWLSPHPDHVILVAEDAQGSLLGFTGGGPVRDPLPPFDAELYTRYLLPPAQRQGFGRRLFLTLADRLIAQGRQHLLLWSLRDNPSTPFYQRLGGAPVAESTTDIGSQSLPTVAFGWRTLASRTWS